MKSSRFGSLDWSTGRFLLVAIAILLGLSAPWTAPALYDYLRWDSAPKHVGIRAGVDGSAGSSQWVVVENAAWDCSGHLEDVAGGERAVVAHDRDGSVIVAIYSNGFDRESDHGWIAECAKESVRPIRGELRHASKSELESLRAHGVNLENDGRVRILDVGNARQRARDIALVGLYLASSFPLALVYLLFLRRVTARVPSWADAPPERRAAADLKLRLLGVFLLASGAVTFVPSVLNELNHWVYDFGIGHIPIAQYWRAFGIPLGAMFLFAPRAVRFLYGSRSRSRAGSASAPLRKTAPPADRSCAICAARETEGADIRVCSCTRCKGVAGGHPRTLCLEHARSH